MYQAKNGILVHCMHGIKKVNFLPLKKKVKVLTLTQYTYELSYFSQILKGPQNNFSLILKML